MTRICSKCKKVLGERCFECGGTNVVKTLAGSPTRFKCLDCGHAWEQGTDGETHGYCDECLQKVTSRQETSE